MAYPAKPLEVRFWPKVTIGGPDDCWTWKGSLTDFGYGRIRLSTSKIAVAHRVAYELLVGPIPEGRVLDHLCRNPSCVNPAHLDPVTQRENVVRGTSPFASRAKQTHCKRGHEFTPENTKLNTAGCRTCRTCLRLWRRDRYANDPEFVAKVSRANRAYRLANTESLREYHKAYKRKRRAAEREARAA